jgi:tRNA 2-thiouridine synthesizing protein C
VFTQDDLVEIAWEDFETEEEVENIVEVVDSERARALMAEADVVFSF